MGLRKRQQWERTFSSFPQNLRAPEDPSFLLEGHWPRDNRPAELEREIRGQHSLFPERRQRVPLILRYCLFFQMKREILVALPIEYFQLFPASMVAT